MSISNSGKVLERLRANEVDLAVVGIEPDGDEFTSRPFAEDEIVLFAGRKHPLARKKRVTWKDLTGQRLIVREPDSATRRLTDALLNKEGGPFTLMELGCPETVKKAVAAGLGLGVLSRYAIAGETRHRDLVELSCPGFPVRRRLYVVHLKRKHLSRMMTGFLDLLK